MPTLIITFVFIGVGWFLLIRPQQQRARAQAAMVAALAAGDDVITAGGIHGTITQVGDDTVSLTVADGVSLQVARAAIAKRVDPAADPTPALLEADPTTALLEDDVTYDADGPDHESTP